MIFFAIRAIFSVIYMYFLHITASATASGSYDIKRFSLNLHYVSQ